MKIIKSKTKARVFKLKIRENGEEISSNTKVQLLKKQGL